MDDVGVKGVVSHTGSNKFGPKERMGLYGRIISCYGENMAFQCINAQEVLVAMIVDDGSKSRSHRANVFNKEFGVMGCYTGHHDAL